jgi:hypothetical protein
MNIFYLDKDPVKCAEMHCDKHVVKMIIEYAQLLSTAHRILDGDLYITESKSSRKVKRWALCDARESDLYLACHVNHPSSIWTRQNNGNYTWLNQLFIALCDEYTYRYGKEHETARKLKGKLTRLPTNITPGFFEEPPQCMPFTCKMLDTIDAYKRYYIREKANFAKWTKRKIPEWFEHAVI